MDTAEQILENNYQIQKISNVTEVVTRRLLDLQNRVNELYNVANAHQARIAKLEHDSLESPEVQDKTEASEASELGMRVYTVHRDGTKQTFRNVTDVVEFEVWPETDIAEAF